MEANSQLEDNGQLLAPVRFDPTTLSKSLPERPSLNASVPADPNAFLQSSTRSYTVAPTESDPLRYRTIFSLLYALLSPSENVVSELAIILCFRPYATAPELLNEILSVVNDEQEDNISDLLQRPESPINGEEDTDGVVTKDIEPRALHRVTAVAALNFLTTWLRVGKRVEFTAEMIDQCKTWLTSITNVPSEKVIRVQELLDSVTTPLQGFDSPIGSPSSSFAPAFTGISSLTLSPPTEQKSRKVQARSMHVSSRLPVSTSDIDIPRAPNPEALSKPRSSTHGSLPSSREAIRAGIRLYDLTPMEAALAMCSIHYSLFKRLKMWELIDAHWKKPDVLTPILDEFISSFNTICYWTATEILRPKAIQARLAKIEYLLDTAVQLKALRNFHGVFAIAAGFSIHPVFRLKGTKSLLNDHCLSILKDLEEFTSLSGNHAVYRRKVQSCMEAKQPFIPHIGVILKDLFISQELSPPERKQGLVDIQRVRAVEGLVLHLKQIQFLNYNSVLKEHRIKKESLRRLNQRIACRQSDKELIEMSLALEPKLNEKQTRETMAISMLMDEGFL